MPDWRDISAIPTSWALTLWDALPVFLSVELAVAIVVMAAATATSRQRYWSLTANYSLGGLIYAATFDRTLTMLIAFAVVFQIALNRCFPPDAGIPPVPKTPRAALTHRFGDVAWSVAKAAFAAAIIKVIVVPIAAPGEIVWYPIAVAAGIVSPVALGTTAIPALAVQSAAGSPIPAAAWLLAALARPYLARQLPRIGLDVRGPDDAS